MYGGKPPGCKQCKSKEFVSQFCQFGMEGHGQCDKGQTYQLVQQFLDQEFYGILQFTPCDLWPLLKGRTLYFSGDSQTQVSLKIFALVFSSEGQGIWAPSKSKQACDTISTHCWSVGCLVDKPGSRLMTAGEIYFCRTL